MTVAVATAGPMLAYQIANESGVPGNELVDIRIPRFFVQMGWETLRVDTSAVRFSEPSGRSVEIEQVDELGDVKYIRRPEMRMIYRTIPRARIVPCVSYQQIALLYEIPDVALIKGSETADPLGKQVYGKYWRWAGDEAQHLHEIEDGKSRKDGLVEVKGLFGTDSRLYGQNGSINNLFFPAGPSSLPEKNVDLIAYLRERKQVLADNPPAEIPLEWRSKILGIADELIAAAELVHTIQIKRLEYTHTCRKLPPSDDLFKADYDSVDEEMLRRTGIPRIHAADVQTADALKLLSDHASSGNPDIEKILARQQEQLELMRQQFENQNALIQYLIASQNAEAPKPNQQARK